MLERTRFFAEVFEPAEIHTLQVYSYFASDYMEQVQKNAENLKELDELIQYNIYELKAFDIDFISYEDWLKDFAELSLDSVITEYSLLIKSCVKKICGIIDKEDKYLTKWKNKSKEQTIVFALRDIAQYEIAVQENSEKNLLVNKMAYLKYLLTK